MLIALLWSLWATQSLTQAPMHIGAALALCRLAYIDHTTGLLPHRWTFFLFLWGLAWAMTPSSPLSLIGSLVGGAFGFCILFMANALYYQIKGQQGLGGGDIFLLMAMGALQGPLKVIDILTLSCLFGLIQVLMMSLWQLYQSSLFVLPRSIRWGPCMVIAYAYVSLF